MLPSKRAASRVYVKDNQPKYTNATRYQDVTERRKDKSQIKLKDLAEILSYLGENSVVEDVLPIMGLECFGNRNNKYIVVHKDELLKSLQNIYDKAHRFSSYYKLEQAVKYNKLDPQWISEYGICRHKYDSMSCEEQLKFDRERVYSSNVSHGTFTKVQIEFRNLVYANKKKMSDSSMLEYVGTYYVKHKGEFAVLPAEEIAAKLYKDRFEK